MQASKTKFAILMAISISAQAQTWVLPTLDGKEGVTQPAAPKPAPKEIDARKLWDAVLGCWPAQSLFRLELSAVARVNNTKTTTINSDIYTTGRSYAGIVATIPIYSAAEIDRERVREYQRRNDAAKVVEELIVNTTKQHTIERELELFRALEQRSKERVTYGIAETSEQVTALKMRADAENKLAEIKGKVLAAKLAAEATCEPSRAHLVREAMQ